MKKTFITVFAVAAALLLARPLFAAEPDPLRAKLDSAVKLYESGDYKKSVQLLEECVLKISEKSKTPKTRTSAEIVTDKGTIKLVLYDDIAPLHVDNFIKLAKSGFYKGLNFHRVVPKFVIQGGDPNGNGTGGPGYTIPAEISTKVKHLEGALAAARTGDEVNPKRESSGSQFYICLEPTPFLDGAYTVYGQVTEGMDVVKSIRQGDKILDVAITGTK